MLADNYLKVFPCDEIYGSHQLRAWQSWYKPGAVMAGADFFDITIKAFGSYKLGLKVQRIQLLLPHH